MGIKGVGELVRGGRLLAAAVAAVSLPLGEGVAHATGPATITEFAAPISSGPYDLTNGPDGNIWVTASGTHKIVKLATDGTLLGEYPLPSANGGPTSIVAGRDGNLWFTEENVNKIGRITTSGQISEFGALDGGHRPFDLTVGPDDHIWFVDHAKGRIGKMATRAGSESGCSPPVGGPSPVANCWAYTYAPGQIIGDYATSSPDSGPVSIASGPDGNLWYTLQNANKIGRVTPQGKITEYDVPTQGSRPFGIAAGPDGNIWFTEESGNKIGRFDPKDPSGTMREFPVPSKGARPMAIESGHDGSLWFNEYGANRIARIGVDGAVTEFYLPTPDSGPARVALGSDGKIWYTALRQHKIGRMLGCAHSEYVAVEGTEFTASGCVEQVMNGTAKTYIAHGDLNLNGVKFRSSDGRGTVTIPPCGTVRCEIKTSGTYDVMVGPAKVVKGAVSRSYDYDRVSGRIRLVPLHPERFHGMDLARVVGDITVTPDDEQGSQVGFGVGVPVLAENLAAVAAIDLERTGEVGSAEFRLGDAAFGPFSIPGATVTYDSEENLWEGTLNLVLTFAKSSKLCGENSGPGGKKAPEGKDYKYGYGCGIAANLKLDADSFFPRGFGGALSGISIPLDPYAVTTLTAIDFDTAWIPGFKFAGGASFVVGPGVGNAFWPIGLSASFSSELFRDQTLSKDIPGVGDVPAEKRTLKNVPFTLHLDGTVSLLTFIQWQKVQAAFYGTSNPFLTLTSTWGPDISVGDCAGFTAQLKVGGAFQYPHFVLEGSGDLSIRWATHLDPKTLVCSGRDTFTLGNAQAHVSTKGMAVCGEREVVNVFETIETVFVEVWENVKNFFGGWFKKKKTEKRNRKKIEVVKTKVSVGVGGNWPKDPKNLKDLFRGFKIFPSGGCDLGAYKQVFDLDKATASGKSMRVRIPRNLRWAVLRMKGTERAPSAQVTGPGLKVKTTTRPRLKATYLPVVDTSRNTTYLQIVRPRGGTYRVTTLRGSSPLKDVSVARAERKARVRGKVLGRGYKRVLRWKANRAARQTISFFEQSRSGRKPIGTTRRARGSLRFRPATAKSGTRKVIAVVSRHGSPQSTVTAARFRGPAPRRPRRPSTVRIRRSADSVLVTWGATGRGTRHYRVRVDAGRQPVVHLPSRRRLVVPHLPRRRKVEVAVRGISALGMKGRVAKARSKGRRGR